jgi:protein phosphatase
MIIKYFTEKGLRRHNEDFILSKQIDEITSIHIVADGMGGYNKGNVASETVAEILFNNISNNSNNKNIIEIIEQAIDEANSKVSQLNIEQKTKMGTTIAGVFIKNNLATMFWVGDVKILHIRNNKVFFESKDHSLINQLKDNNSFSKKTDYSKIRHIVTRSVQGANDKNKADFSSINLNINDKILIYSDGIANQESVINIVKLNESDINIFSQKFKQAKDNASLIYIKW